MIPLLLLRGSARNWAELIKEMNADNRMLKRSGWITKVVGAIVGLSNGVLQSPIALAASRPLMAIDQSDVSERIAASSYIRPRATCPTRLSELISPMLRDLPGYANSVSQRAALSDEPADSATYVLLVGRAEYEPLTQGPGEYLPATESDLPQVFFTTLERLYIHDRPVNLQVFHWLFLTQTRVGWRLVLMQSAIGHAPDPVNPEPPTPPQDNSQGVIAQAIRLWLRDCEAGSVYP